MVNGLPESGSNLGSQPTFSRLENSITLRDIFKLNDLLLDMYIEKLKRSGRKEIILDIDATEDPVHGEQEFALFNGYYDKTIYLENLVFDGNTGDMVYALLKPGNNHCSNGIVPTIHRITRKITEKIPGIKITIRGDSGYGSNDFMAYCENYEHNYLLGLKANDRLYRRVKKLSDKAVRKSVETGEEKRYFTSFCYSAKSWGGKLRDCVAKVSANKGNLDVRFIITNMYFKRSKEAYEMYGKRGQMENYIKDLKNDLKSDRLSCHRFLANYFRLMISCFAYDIMMEIRNVLEGTELEKSQSCTIRLKLLKIGAIVRETVRKVWIEMSSSFPNRETFMLAYNKLN
jgi:hypothetical protein